MKVDRYSSFWYFFTPSSNVLGKKFIVGSIISIVVFFPFGCLCCIVKNYQKSPNVCKHLSIEDNQRIFWKWGLLLWWFWIMSFKKYHFSYLLLEKKVVRKSLSRTNTIWYIKSSTLFYYLFAYILYFVEWMLEYAIDMP